MKKLHLLSFVLVLIIISCETQQKIEGTWLVKSVTVGEEEMTPNARWMRFNADSTQQSGNGLFQHSFGSWALDKNKLKMINTNGLNDPFEAFDISFTDHKMTWQRMEEDQAITVTLERIKNLPLTYGDQLLGLWKLEKAIGNDIFFSESEEADDYLFIRWDNRFIINTDSARISGVYQVNGHRPLITIIPYDEKLSRSNWEIQFDENQITLTKMNVDSVFTRRFSRIYDFPE